MIRPQNVLTRNTMVWMALTLASMQGLGARHAEAAGGLKITPARTDVTIVVGDPAPTGTYQVKNTSPRTLSITAEDNVSWLTLSPTSFTLSPGATQTVSYTTTALSTGGPYIAKLYFTARPSAAGANAPVATIMIRLFYRVVASKTDLVVSNLVISPSTSVACGQPFSVKATLKNAGGKASGPFRIRWTQNNVIFYTGTHPSLNSGAVSKDYTAILNFKQGKPKGIYSYALSADINAKINESNETNNLFYKSIAVSCP